MESLNGRRKTPAVTAEQKAKAFVEGTQAKPKYVLRKRNTEEAMSSIAQERQNILNEMRVRHKKLDSWMADGKVLDASESSNMHLKIQPQVFAGMPEKKVNSPAEDLSNPELLPLTDGLLRMAVDDVNIMSPRTKEVIDHKSIADQEETKKHWEEKIATGDISLFPRQPTTVKKTSIDISNFKSDVETESIGDLASTKRQWESRALETDDTPKFPGLPRSVSHSAGISHHSPNPEQNLRPPVRSKSQSVLPNNPPEHLDNMPQQLIQNSSPHFSALEEYEEVFQPLPIPENESIIERDIRLANEKERELEFQRRRLNKLQKAALSDNFLENKTSTSNQELHRSSNMTSVNHHSKLYVETNVPYDNASSTNNVELDGNRNISGYRGKHHIHQHSKELQIEEDEKKRRQSRHPPNPRESILEREIRLQKEREESIRHERDLAMHSIGLPPPTDNSDSDHVDNANIKVLSNNNQSANNHAASNHINFHDIHQLNIQESSTDEPLNNSHNYPSMASVSPASSQRSSQSTTCSSRSYEEDRAPGNDAISYERAISQTIHAGESIIARELREQREREAELQKHWNELGYMSPVPKQESPSNLITKSIHSDQVGRGSETHVHGNGDGRLRDEQRVTPERQYLHAGPSVHRSISPSISDSGSNSSINPWAPDDPVSKFNAGNESSIEREIRLVKEREEMFRKERGLSHATQPSKEVELPLNAPIQPGPYPVFGENKAQSSTMKRLAASRIQNEMMAEKQREIEVRHAYRLNHPSSSPNNQSGKGSPSQITNGNQKHKPITIHIDEPNRHLHMTRGGPEPSLLHANNNLVPSPSQNGVSRIHRAASPTADLASREQHLGEQKRTPNRGTSIIERELNEMKQREEELRRQRQQLH